MIRRRIEGCCETSKDQNARRALEDRVIAPAIPYPRPQLSTDVFALRRFRDDDYAIAHDVGEDPATSCWVNPLPGSDGAEAVRFFESQRRRGHMLDLVIAEPRSDRYLGEVLLFKREWETGEIAYVVAPSVRGRGIATDAVKLLSGSAFEELRLQRLQLKVDPENVASHRVATKAGFQREHLPRSSFVLRGRRRD